MSIQTSYMGLSLQSPLVVASCGYSANVDNIVAAEQAGAGAVVLKSLFQEQLASDVSAMMKDVFLGSHADTGSFVAAHSVDYFLDQYLALLEEAKKRVSIPIIASVNCRQAGDWIKYLPQLERYGADGIELNMYNIAVDTRQKSVSIEKEYVQLIKKVRQTVSIPVSIKIAPYFTNLASFVEQLDQAGADGVVLFNRLFASDVDIHSLKVVSGNPISSPGENGNTLRWIALLYSIVDLNLCSNTGVHSGEDLIKQILVGAQAVEVCSAVLKGGVSVITEMNSDLEKWMKEKGYQDLQDFRGALSQKECGDPSLWKRSQYIKTLTGMC